MNSTNFSFSEACEYLSLPPADFTVLREQGLVVALIESGNQFYPKLELDLVSILLKIEAERGWSHTTIAWYADLVLAMEVGRSILLPIPDNDLSPLDPSTNWLITPYVQIVLDNLQGNIENEESSFVSLLRGLVAIGEERLWIETEPLEHSGLYPIIAYFENQNIPIIHQQETVARDVGYIALSLILVFTTIMPPISQQLATLITRIKPHYIKQDTVSNRKNERLIIQREGLVAVDKIYASKVAEIHTPPNAWDFRLGIVSAQRRTITLQMKVAPDSTEAMIDNIIDLIRPFVGTYGARVIHLLYQIANDPPRWRSPLITVSTNELLDKLGVKRDAHGFHRVQNRRRLRDVLNASHDLEIIGEYTTWQDGHPINKAFYKTVLSLIGADFDPAEREGIPTSQLRLKGLPKTIQVRLNFYDGVRRPDGELGDHYVLMPPLDDPKNITNASRTGAEELLKVFLFYRYRQTRMASPILIFSRAVVLEKASIKNKNSSQATATLRKALDKLVASGVIESYSPEIPIKPQSILEITLSEATVRLLDAP